MTHCMHMLACGADLLALAEVALEGIQEAVAGLECTCSSCSNKEHVTAALIRALASAQQLVKHLE